MSAVSSTRFVYIPHSASKAFTICLVTFRFVFRSSRCFESWRGRARGRDKKGKWGCPGSFRRQHNTDPTWTERTRAVPPFSFSFSDRFSVVRRRAESIAVPRRRQDKRKSFNPFTIDMYWKTCLFQAFCPQQNTGSWGWGNLEKGSSGHTRVADWKRALSYCTYSSSRKNAIYLYRGVSGKKPCKLRTPTAVQRDTLLSRYVPKRGASNSRTMSHTLRTYRNHASHRTGVRSIFKWFLTWIFIAQGCYYSDMCDDSEPCAETN